MLIKDTYPVESKTAVFSERTGLGVNRDGGKGDAERISFLPGIGDLKDNATVHDQYMYKFRSYIYLPFGIKFCAGFVQRVMMIVTKHLKQHRVVRQVMNEC